MTPVHVLSLIVALSVSVAGCATVRPYERETFTRPDMELTAERAGAAQTAHAMEVREGAAGGFGAAGGGCGCN